MKTLGCAAAAVAVIVLAGAVPASAHPAPFSYLDIVFRDGHIDGTLVMHVIDVAHELGIAPPERLLDAALVERERQRIGGILAPRLTLRTNRPLVPQWGAVEVLKEDLAIRLRFRIANEQPGALVIDTNLFPYD